MEGDHTMNKKTYNDLKKQWKEGKIEASHTMILTYMVEDLIEALKDKIEQ